MADVLTITQPCALDLECPEGVEPPDESSFELARYLFSVRGKSVLDLGSGTGLLGIAAAKLGARQVVATDLSPEAVECTRRNASRNSATIEVRQGHLFEPVSDRKFDLIVTRLPQLPAPPGATGPRFAGPDGLANLEAVLTQGLGRLEEGGQVLTLVHSLAHTKRFEAMLSERFRFRALPQSRRLLKPEDLERVGPGLFDFIRERASRGLAEIEEEAGTFTYVVRYYLAIRR